MAGYTKLFGTIITSTVWQEDAETKVVWITLLALLDKNGVAEATIPGIAHIAKVSIEKVEAAIKIFSEPDKYSRSQEHDGRRIEKIDGGYLILNAAKYRAKMRGEERTEYIRNYQRERREKLKEKNVVNFVNKVNQVNPSKPIAKAKAEAKAYKNTIAQNFDKFWQAYPKKLGKKQSLQQWTKLNPDEKLVEQILIGVKTQSKTEQWIKEDGKYIPYPERFLKHRRWEDEVEIIQHKTPFQLSMEAIENEEKPK